MKTSGVIELICFIFFQRDCLISSLGESFRFTNGLGGQGCFSNFKMSRYDDRSRNRECKVYVGDLPRDATEEELDKVFNYYGPIRNIWVSRNPAGFAFVEYEDGRDAEDSVRELDGTKICGVRARVEISTGPRRGRGGRGGGRGGFRGGRGGARSFNPDDRCYSCGDRGHYAYDCNRGGGGGGRGRRSYSRSRSRERRRSYSRSRSR